MDKLRRSLFAASAHDDHRSLLRRKRFVLPLLVLLTLAAAVIDVISGAQISFGAGYFLVVAIAAYFLSPKWGGVAAVAMLGVELIMNLSVWPDTVVVSSQLTLTTLLNNAIIYAITIALFVIVHDVNRLREENLRLRTLRQTMVTVNDIVFNRIQYLSVLLDLVEGGAVLTARQIEIGRQALQEVTQKLRQLSRLTEVNSYLAAGDVEAVLLEDDLGDDTVQHGANR